MSRSKLYLLMRGLSTKLTSSDSLRTSVSALCFRKAKDLLKSLSVKFETVELDQIEKGPQYQAALFDISGQKTVPNIYIHGNHLGGCDKLLDAHSKGTLSDWMENKMQPSQYEYDLVVIGGGSGGLAAAKEAADLGKKVALLDFVKPSPAGSSWGLGGTCVNVGCIPKKLMHRASILGEDLEHARSYGWNVPEKGQSSVSLQNGKSSQGAPGLNFQAVRKAFGSAFSNGSSHFEHKPGRVTHSWDTMRDGIQNHIGSLNWGYRVQLRDKKVNYVNAYAEIVDKNTITATKKNNSVVTMTAENILVATGERPRYPEIPGARDYCITSDDLFSLSYCPGKTLCVGASYVSLECAGFLAGLGLDVTVMVRSILLRGFDQQCAEMIGSYMEKHGVQFIRKAVPQKIERLERGEPGRYRVTSITTDGKEFTEEYNTILIAIGRDPCTKGIGLEHIGVHLDSRTKKVVVNEKEQTNIPNVYAIGDIVKDRFELTPVAIEAGKLLSKRLFKPGEKTLVDYTNVATTVFTPLEYGCIGYSEEAATEKFGEDKIEVYHSFFHPLEWTVPHKQENTCYAKLICLKTEKEKVIGFHVLGPNAGEITQGYALAMKLGARKSDFDSTIGIHPTCSETFTTMHVTKRSGATAEVTGC